MKTILSLFIVLSLNAYGQYANNNGVIILSDNSFMPLVIASMSTEEGLQLQNQYIVYSEDLIFALISFSINEFTITTTAKRGGFDGEIYFRKNISLLSFKKYGTNNVGNEIYLYADKENPHLVLMYNNNTGTIKIIYYPFEDWKSQSNYFYSEIASSIPEFDLSKHGIYIEK